MASARRLAAIMFTDMVGFTPLAQADEAGALRLITEQDRQVRPLAATHGGRIVKSTGDGLLLEFPDALDAVECAVALQRHVHEFNAGAPAQPLNLRVGIHLGDVERRGTDIFGDAVNIASRVESFAEPGGVCLSAQVYDQVQNKVPYRLEKLGLRTLKGVREPVGIYRVVLPWTGSVAAASGPSIPRLAVLPLANISPDPQDAYLADGLTEELISTLSQIRGLRVIARTSVNQYKGTSKSVGQIGSELGVSTVLEGSVRKSGDQLRISVQLIDVGSEEHRWAETFDRHLENVFAIQAEVAERTAGALRVELLAPERAALGDRPTKSLAAYEAYLRGVQLFQRWPGHESYQSDVEGEKFFEEAIRLDPGFSAAYSYLANHLLASLGITRPRREVLPRVRELVAKALELDPDSSDAHTASGNLTFQADLDWAGAEREFRRAIALCPSSSVAHFWYGLLLGTLQRHDESKEQYHIAIELDPLWAQPKVNLVEEYLDAGDPAAATALGERLLENSPRSLGIRGNLAWVYARTGRPDDAARTVAVLEGVAEPLTRATRGYILALVGKTAELKTFLKELESGQIREYVSPARRAEWHALLGEKEVALTLLETDCREGDRTLWNVYQSEALEPLRDEPRFLAMLKAMDLPRPVSRAPRPARPGRWRPTVRGRSTRGRS